MKKRSAKVTAMFLSAAMTVTAVPADIYGASDLEAAAIQAEEAVSVEAENEPGESEDIAGAAGDVQWVVSQDKNYWQEKEDLTFTDWDDANHESLYIDVDETITYQEMAENVWGGCFNERGWERMSHLSEEDRSHILDLLFDPDEPEGLHLTMARMPIGSSDYAMDMYSFDETEDDYELKDFSIDRDKEKMIPYIKEALKRNPDLKIWASPWSPPWWMKMNADGSRRTEKNGGYIEYTDANMKAYAQYFVKFLEAYEEEGIHIYMVMPQNEPTMNTPYSSCVWTGEQLCGFIRDYLGPALEGTGVEIYLGTFTNSLDNRMDPELNDPECRKYLSGAGFQWWSWMKANSLYNTGFDLKMMQSETMCGDGWNNWTYAENQFDLFWTYLESGITEYNLWNMVLEFDGVHAGGANTAPNPWYQNAPITVNVNAGTYQLSPQYYEVRHFTEFIKAGARRIETSGTYCDGYRESDAESDAAYTAECRDIAFRNTDGMLVVEVKNGSSSEKTVDIRFGDKKVTATLPAHSINSFTTQGTPLTGEETDMHEIVGKENVKTFINVLSGKCMCINGDVVAAGKEVIQWPYGGEANQSWYLVDADNGVENCVKIFNVKNRKLVAADGGSTSAGAKMITWYDEDADDQKWVMEKDDDTGYYRFKNYKSNLYLTVANANDLTKVTQEVKSDSEGQLWNVIVNVEKPDKATLEVLDGTVSEAEKIVKENEASAVYTEESLNTLKAALTSAKQTAENEAANEGRNNKAEVENAIETLKNAISGLVLKAQPTVTPKPTVTPEQHKPHVGETFVRNGLKYKVTKDDESGREVRVTSMKTNAKTLKIPATVTNSEWKETFKVTSIKAKAFKGKGITKVSIGKNVTKIGPNAFLNCKKLKSVVIGKNVKNIGIRAFYGCAKLTKVTIKSTALKTVKKNAFKRISKKAVIKVPKSRKKSYKKLLKGKITSGNKIK